MTRPKARTSRVQVYLSDPKTAAALAREARAGRVSLSQAAGQAIVRGLQASPKADPGDRLQTLEMALRDHMRAMARDMGIVQELVVEVARAFFIRLPDVLADEDPLLKASVEARIERLLDDTAARIVAGRSRETVRAAETRSFEARG
jgi:hypothetical protein